MLINIILGGGGGKSMEGYGSPYLESQWHEGYMYLVASRSRQGGEAGEG